ncbi:NAD-dependent epimerase/dehydratase family protein [Nioella aestuarii]|uniref:NAD-dependent epimerase/dehydratase family protein n=1 Tax=Nioella aestuarii TaxID=1662864 RepID=UPI003D7F2CE0
MGKVLVTGANGHVGFNLVEELVRRGADLRVSVRDAKDPAKTGPLRALGVKDIVTLDVQDADAFRAATEGIDLLYHVAATYRYVTSGPGADEQMVRDAVEGAIAAIRAAAASNVRKVVMTSSTVTLPLGTSPEDKKTEIDWTEDLSVAYIRAKTLAEKRAWDLAEELGVNMVAVLPAGIFGGTFHKPTQSTDFVEAIAKGALRMGSFEGVMPFVDVRDVVDGHIRAAEQDVSGRFILCNDRFPSFDEIIDILRGQGLKLGRPLMTVPQFMYPMAPAMNRMISRMIGAPPLITPEFVAMNKGRYFASSNQRAKDVLGWQPTISTEDSIRDTVAELRRIGRL